jgi:hypothetical protein
MSHGLCTCSASRVEGPDVDCPIHGVLQAFNEVSAENEKLRQRIKDLEDGDMRFIEGQADERNRCMDVASILVAHLLVSDHPQAETWVEALDWFRKRIKGGHLSIYAQQEFDKRFGVVDWSAFAASPDSSEEGSR